jgi:hypothetical protein
MHPYRHLFFLKTVHVEYDFSNMWTSSIFTTTTSVRYYKDFLVDYLAYPKRLIIWNIGVVVYSLSLYCIPSMVDYCTSLKLPKDLFALVLRGFHDFLAQA